jgi:predicted transcriptional regulator
MKIMIGIRIEPELKGKLEKLADEENRSLSNFIVNATLTYIKDHKNIDLKKSKN